MSEFKISPAMQCKTRPKSHFLFWFLLTTFALNIGAAGWIFFRLSNQIASLEQRLCELETKDGGAHVQQ
jgi:hypothetical protein